MTETTLVDGDRYRRLLGETMPTVVRTEEQNDHYLELLEELDRRSAQLTPEETELAALLTVLIEEFEARQYPIQAPSPEGALTALMEEHNLKQKDLLDVFGTPSIVSEVLAGKRRMTVEHIRALCQRFAVPAELFL